MADQELLNEENYLRQVYRSLLQSKKEAEIILDKVKKEGISALSNASSEIRLNYDSSLDNLDTFTTIEMKNREIDQLNIKVDSADTQLKKIKRLLESPYFGKVTVDFLDNEPIDDFYIGVSHFTDQYKENLVYDWRSPIAELFYNNKLGSSHYVAHGRDINVVIKNRRQFIIEKKRLLRYFDTSIAIQDDVLIDALEQDTTQQMKDITATIQSEQNVIIRDLKNRHILVNGIAGSGKTSTIMQRIAYLLYSLRQEITSDNILILSPNNHFIEYISAVLPSLGEKNPLNLTLLQFVHQYLPLKLENESDYFFRISTATVSHQTEILRSKEFVAYIQQADELFQTANDFFKDLIVNGEIIISKKEMKSLFKETPSNEKLMTKIQGTKQRLLTHVEEQILKQAQDSRVQDQIYSMSEDMQQQYFGELISVDSEKSILKYATKMLRKQYRKIIKDIQTYQWITVYYLFEKIYTQYTGKEYLYSPNEQHTLDEAVILMFVQSTFIEKFTVPKMQFILVDEIQDYTPAQIELLLELFPDSDFTIVGDENQAIFNSSIRFAQLASSFEEKSKPIRRYDLLNSYRSSGAITELFRRLVSSDKQMNIVPVRPKGNEPKLFSFDKITSLVPLLRKLTNEIADEKLTIITKTVTETDSILKVLKEYEELMKTVEVLPISYSKGLEFDNVLIFNASAENFHTEREKRILYTACSRAMNNVFISYQSELTSFLS